MKVSSTSFLTHENSEQINWSKGSELVEVCHLVLDDKYSSRWSWFPEARFKKEVRKRKHIQPVPSSPCHIIPTHEMCSMWLRCSGNNNSRCWNVCMKAWPAGSESLIRPQWNFSPAGWRWTFPIPPASACMCCIACWGGSVGRQIPQMWEKADCYGSQKVKKESCFALRREMTVSCGLCGIWGGTRKLLLSRKGSRVCMPPWVMGCSACETWIWVSVNLF